MSGYIGTIPTPQATMNRDVFTATAGQTSFPTSGYTPSYLDVYLNGAHLVNGTDFTASNGSDVVLTSGAAAGDNVEIVIFKTFETDNNGGRYKGDRGTIGAVANAGDIFRVHEQQLDVNVTIDATENALAAGPLTLNATLTVNGNLTVV